MEEFRRFKFITDDELKKDRLMSLLKEKNLSKEDLYLIFTSLVLNFDIFDRVLKELF